MYCLCDQRVIWPLKCLNFIVFVIFVFAGPETLRSPHPMGSHGVPGLYGLWPLTQNSTGTITSALCNPGPPGPAPLCKFWVYFLFFLQKFYRFGKLYFKFDFCLLFSGPPAPLCSLLGGCRISTWQQQAPPDPGKRWVSFDIICVSACHSCYIH